MLSETGENIPIIRIAERNHVDWKVLNQLDDALLQGDNDAYHKKLKILEDTSAFIENEDVELYEYDRELLRREIEEFRSFVTPENACECIRKNIRINEQKIEKILDGDLKTIEEANPLKLASGKMIVDGREMEGDIFAVMDVALFFIGQGRFGKSAFYLCSPRDVKRIILNRFLANRLSFECVDGNKFSILLDSSKMEQEELRRLEYINSLFKSIFNAPISIKETELAQKTSLQYMLAEILADFIKKYWTILIVSGLWGFFLVYGISKYIVPHTKEIGDGYDGIIMIAFYAFLGLPFGLTMIVKDIRAKKSVGIKSIILYFVLGALITFTCMVPLLILALVFGLIK